MRLDFKKVKIQQKYKQLKEKERKKKHNTAESVIVIFLVAIGIILLNITSISNNNFTEIDSDELIFYENRVKEDFWVSTQPIIDKELKQTYGDYIGISIDYNPKTIKIIIRTSLTEYSNQEKIITHVNEIIKANNSPKFFNEQETYEIMIIGENNEQLKNKIFH